MLNHKELLDGFRQTSVKQGDTIIVHTSYKSLGGVQGGAEMGAYATAFPGGLPVNPENAAALAAQWGFPVPDAPGMGATQMIEAADQGEEGVGGAGLDEAGHDDLEHVGPPVGNVGQALVGLIRRS